MQTPGRRRVHLQRAAPGPGAVGALPLLGAPRPRAADAARGRDPARAARGDVHARVQDAVQGHALQLAQRVEERRAHDDAPERIAGALGGIVQLRVGDSEPGCEGAGVAQRLAAQQRLEVGGAIVRAAQVGGQAARPGALVAQLLGQPVALGARGVAVGERLLEPHPHVAQLALAAVELARRAHGGDAVAAQEDGAVGIEPQRPRALGALGGVRQRHDDAAIGDVEPDDARGQHLIALGLDLGRAVPQRHERVGTGEQLDLVAVVAASPHAHAHDVARPGLLGDRRELVGLERLQVEPWRAVGRELAHACAHALADAQHVVAGVHEAAREIARAHAGAAVGERERGGARIERDDLALDVLADGVAAFGVGVLDAERRQQAALGLALAALERVHARVLRGAIREREARVVDPCGAAPDRELVAERLAQRVRRLAGLDEHHLCPPAEAPCERSRIHERAPVAGRDHHFGKLALRRQ